MNFVKDGAVNLKNQIRCEKCKKLLALRLQPQHFEVKCARCGQLNTFFDSRNERILILGEDERIVFVNNAMAEVMEESLDELVGKKIKEIWKKNCENYINTEVWDMVREKKTPFQVVFDRTDKEGEKNKVNFVISPILGTKNSVVFFMCIEVEYDFAY